jgi:hypothetical protein
LNKLFAAIEDVSEHPSDTGTVILPESSITDSNTNPYSEAEREIVRRKSSKYDNVNISVPANDGEVELLKQMFELNMSKLESQMSSKLNSLESQLLYEREANDALKSQVETLIGKTLSQEQFNKFATDYQDSLKTNAAENLTSYLDEFKNDIKNNLEKKVDKIINGLELKELGPPIKSSPSQGLSKVSLIPTRQVPQAKVSLAELGPPQPSNRLETRRTISNFVDAWSESNDDVAPSSDNTTDPEDTASPDERSQPNVSGLFRGAAKGIIESRRASLSSEQSATGPTKRMSIAHISELAKPKSVVPKNPIAIKSAKAEVQSAASKKSSPVAPVESNIPKKASIAYISELAKPRSVVPKNPITARRSSITNTEAETEDQKSTNPNITKLRAKVTSRASVIYLEQLSKQKEVPKSLDSAVKADVKPIIEGFNAKVQRNSGIFM